MSNITTLTQAAPTSLVEEFAAKYKVDGNKLLNTLKLTAFSGSKSPTNEEMMALLVVANAHNLNPFTKEIYAFPNKGKIIPVVSIDGWARICNEHPNFDGMEFRWSDEMVENAGAKSCSSWCEAVIYRKDYSHPMSVREFLDETYKPGNGPWQTHTKRMLRHKAMIQCARLAFGFSGISDHDEAINISKGVGEAIDPVDITPLARPKRDDYAEPDITEVFTAIDEYGVEFEETFTNEEDFVNALIDHLINVPNPGLQTFYENNSDGLSGVSKKFSERFVTAFVEISEMEDEDGTS